MQVPVIQQILKANDQVAIENEKLFRAAGVRVVNVMASPGAGKTSLILQALDRLPRLPERLGAGVIEGDIASSIDADLIAAHGVPVVQINTGGNCHLDAPMIRSALEHLPLDSIDVLFIENVGNLICPANYRLGADLNLVIASVPEGHDKPYKYPGMFANADLVALNKYDLADVFEFDDAAFDNGVRMVNPTVPIHRVSARTGAGVEEWLSALLQQLAPQPA